MILVDSSVWIDHLRRSEQELVIALTEHQVIQHPVVTIELALGSLADRARLISMLRFLPQAPIASEDELLDYIDNTGIAGTGIGIADAHLLASAAGTNDCRLWTRDKRLLAQAKRLDLAYQP